MRWLITGAGGQLGSDLVAVLSRGTDGSVAALTRHELDITDPVAVTAAMAEHRPDVVVNAAAYTAVDAAQTDEPAAYRVNAIGPGVLAAGAARSGARLIQVSTDYVFDGDAGRPYVPEDVPSPRSAYGRTKLAGERVVLDLLPDSGYVVRTAWVYGQVGSNFVKTMLRLERDRATVDVVDDQRGSPTWSRELAEGLAELGRSTAPPGLYHCTGGGDTTWCGLGQAIFAAVGADPARVRPVSTAQFPRPAARPRFSVLSNARWREAGLTPLRDWQAALAAALPLLQASRET